MGGVKLLAVRDTSKESLAGQNHKVGVWRHPRANAPWLERVENDVGFHPTLAHVPHALSGPDIIGTSHFPLPRARDDPGTARTQGSTAFNPTDWIATGPRSFPRTLDSSP